MQEENHSWILELPLEVQDLILRWLKGGVKLAGLSCQTWWLLAQSIDPRPGLPFSMVADSPELFRWARNWVMESLSKKGVSLPSCMNEIKPYCSLRVIEGCFPREKHPSQLLFNAARVRNFTLAELLLMRETKVTGKVVRVLIEQAAPNELLDYIVGSLHITRADNPSSAIRSGSVRVLDWLVNFQEFAPGRKHFKLALEKSTPEVFNWLRRKSPSGDLGIDPLLTATRAGNLAQLENLLNSDLPFHSANLWDSFLLACRVDNLQVFLVFQRNGLPLTSEVIGELISMDSEEILKYLISIGRTFTQEEAATLASRGELELLKLLSEGGMKFSSVVYVSAAFSNDPTVLDWLREQGIGNEPLPPLLQRFSQNPGIFRFFSP